MEQISSRKKILILGAGTAGTMIANKLANHRTKYGLDITLVDQASEHYYQPGFLFIPFGVYGREDVVKRRSDFIPRGVTYIQNSIEKIDTTKKEIVLHIGEVLPYDILIIATGAQVAPEQIPNLIGDRWRKNMHEFYTFEGANALYNTLKDWPGGKLVIHISEMPIKCPVAPLEFSFLADDFFKKKNMRDKVEITYVTPLSGAFTKPEASRVLGGMLSERNIKLVPDFSISEVDAKENIIRSYDEKTVPFDLLVTIPPNMGDALIARSGLGDELNFIPTDKNTLQATGHENIFVIGDATNIPASKAGSVAHFEAEILEENILSFLEGKPLSAKFDGHANCYVESGDGKALLVDFGYDIEPVEGTFPLPFIGPFSLLKPTVINHLGKLAFRYIYWNVLMRGLSIPFVGPGVPLAGKKIKK
ncbi:MAG: sulfide:quinone oxidoreductase [Patescibacteria group bacterium]|nr:sulfide:quinone oxidoreductase [Patescibacteria group bacterium]